MSVSWEEEVEEVFQELRRGYLTDEDAKERIEEFYHLIPEDSLEAIYEKIEDIAFELEEERWTQYLDEQYALLPDDDDKEWIS